MGRINVLGFDVANLIAAGEVVDRPASVVKELCENALDAGATVITVEIRHGGTTFIRVSDNGVGIDAEDMPLTVLRHATSKIANAEDLQSIGTLGFRGEALAAIAAVTKLKMMSATRDSQMGTTMICEGGEIIDLVETGCAVGTTVIASELFYNVPARRKFLKKDASECAAVTAVMEKLALSAPGVSVKYITDGEVRFMTSGDGDLKGTVYSVFGKAVASRMTAVDRTSGEGIRISGYIGEPDLIRANKNSENFFINGRFVKSRTAMAALEQAYATRIPSQKFPVCVLNIGINPAVVDVNVHPSKLEVKFANERLIFEAVYYAVLNALEASASRPELQLPDNGVPTQKTPFTPYKRNVYNGANPLRAFVPVERPAEEKREKAQIRIQEEPRTVVPPVKTETAVEKAPEINTVQKPAETAKPVCAEKKEEPKSLPVTEFSRPVPKEETEPETKKEVSPPPVINTVKEEKEAEPEAEERVQPPEYRIIGEAYNCYVIVELSDRLLMIDKHAAHERILFDELCRRMKEKKRRGQMLLYPICAPVSDAEKNALDEHYDKLSAIGFGITYNSEKKEISVNEIPEELGREAAEKMITELLSQLAESTGSIEAAEARYFEAKLYQASCKAAIKGGRVYGTDHIKWICDRLLTPPDEKGAVIKTCPHGRPVAFEIKKSSIDRQFDRIN